ncbi:MAG: DMT family transporter [Anaerovoracaceae bacterium]
MHKRYNINAYIAGLCSALIVGFSFLAIKICIPYGSPFEIIVFRFNTALVVAIIALIINLKRHKIKRVRPLLIIGLSYIVFVIFQTLGVYYLSSVESAIIFAAAPIVVQILAAVFLKEYTNKTQNIFILITVTSLLIMVIKNAKHIEFNGFGVLLITIGMLGLATNTVLIRKHRGEYLPTEISSITIITGGIIFNIGAIIDCIVNDNLGHYIELIHNGKFMVGVVFLGIFCIFISSTLMAFINKRLKAVQASLFGSLSTVVSLLAGVIILGEDIFIYQVVCSVGIIVGIIGVNAWGDGNG